MLLSSNPVSHDAHTSQLQTLLGRWGSGIYLCHPLTFGPLLIGSHPALGIPAQSCWLSISPRRSSQKGNPKWASGIHQTSISQRDGSLLCSKGSHSISALLQGVERVLKPLARCTMTSSAAVFLGPNCPSPQQQNDWCHSNCPTRKPPRHGELSATRSW